jgi:redox-sensitive bicupin YhaK (pirin superfamily)
MEIITYILDGELEHRDNMGNGSVLKRGELQHMTAGTGIRHSEFNPSKTNPVHLYQIWLTPWRKGLVPSYSQTKVDESTADKQLRLIASPDGHNGSLAICQDARIYLSSLAGSESVHYSVSPSRAVWVQVLRGEVKVLGQVLRDGYGAAITNESDLSLAAVGNGFSEVMLFDLP